MKRLLMIIVVAAVVVGLYFIGSGEWKPFEATPAAPAALVQPADAGAPAEPAAAPAEATDAVVDYVHDGDTLFLTDGRKVRLLAVNTPEIGENAGECYGEEATSTLRELVPEGSPVRVQQDIEALDQYGRSLLFVYTESGVNVNLALLERGAAEVEMYEPNVLLRDEARAAEESARSAGLGLWGSLLMSASDHLAADLLPRRGGPLLQGGRHVLSAVAAVAGFGLDAVPTLDLVVTRRDTGAEVMRTKADLGDPGWLLDQVREDLENKSVEEFFAEWKLPTPEQ